MRRSFQRSDRNQLCAFFLAAQRNIHAQRIAAGIGDDEHNIPRTHVDLFHEDFAGSFHRFISIVGWFYNFLRWDESACAMRDFHCARHRMAAAPSLDNAAVDDALSDRLRRGFNVFLLCLFDLVNQLMNRWEYFIGHFQFLHFLHLL